MRTSLNTFLKTFFDMHMNYFLPNVILMISFISRIGFYALTFFNIPCQSKW